MGVLRFLKRKIIKKIYLNTISEVIDDVPVELKKEFSNSYHKYLLKIYLDDELEEEDESIYTELELSRWKRASCSLKLSEILKDKAYERIKKNSARGLHYAEQRLEESSNGCPTISLMRANKNIQRLERDLQKVRGFNKDVAKILVSEGIVDFLYACGRSEFISLRLSH